MNTVALDAPRLDQARSRTTPPFFYSICTLMGLFILLTEIGRTELASIVSVGLLLCFALSPLETNTYQLIFFAPTCMYVLFFGSSVFNFFLFIYAVKYIFLRRTLPIYSLVVTGVLFAIEIFQIALHDNINMLFLALLLKWTIAVFVFTIIVFDRRMKLNFDEASMWFVAIMVIACISVILCNIGNVTDITDRDNVPGSLYIPKNTFGCFGGVAFSCILNRLYIHKRGYLKSFVGIVVILAGSVYLISKMFLLSMVASVFVYLPLFVKNRKLLILVLTVLGAIVIALVAVPSFRETFEVLLYRFSIIEDVSDLSTGRTDLFKEYMDYLLSHIGTLLFGEGLFSYNNFGIHNSPHMLLLEMVCAWGLVLSLVIFTMLVFMIRKSRMASWQEKRYYQYIPLIWLLINLQSSTILNQVYVWFVFLLVICSIYGVPKNTVAEKNKESGLLTNE